MSISWSACIPSSLGTLSTRSYKKTVDLLRSLPEDGSTTIQCRVGPVSSPFFQFRNRDLYLLGAGETPDQIRLFPPAAMAYGSGNVAIHADAVMQSFRFAADWASGKIHSVSSADLAPSFVWIAEAARFRFVGDLCRAQLRERRYEIPPAASKFSTIEPLVHNWGHLSGSGPYSSTGGLRLPISNGELTGCSREISETARAVANVLDADSSESEGEG